MRKKGQITMESLLLYGAAILVVLLAIAALTYFGVLDLGRLLPDKCNLEATGVFVCEEWRIDDTANTVAFSIRNKGPKPLEINKVEFSTQLASCENTPGTPPINTIQPGKLEAFSISSCGNTWDGLEPGDRVKGTLTVKHIPTDGKIEIVTTGELVTSLS